VIRDGRSRELEQARHGGGGCGGVLRGSGVHAHDAPRRAPSPRRSALWLRPVRLLRSTSSLAFARPSVSAVSVQVSSRLLESLQAADQSPNTVVTMSGLERRQLVEAAYQEVRGDDGRGRGSGGGEGETKRGESEIQRGWERERASAQRHSSDCLRSRLLARPRPQSLRSLRGRV
jgi:hypothetical protein